MTKSPHMSRNEFVKWVVGILGGLMAAVVGLPAIGYVLSPALKKRYSEAWIPLGPLENYPVGTPTLVDLRELRLMGGKRRRTAMEPMSLGQMKLIRQFIQIFALI